jgi:hypothetical protein
MRQSDSAQSDGTGKVLISLADRACAPLIADQPAAPPGLPIPAARPARGGGGFARPSRSRRPCLRDFPHSPEKSRVHPAPASRVRGAA